MTKTAKNLNILPLFFWLGGGTCFFIFINLIKSILLPFIVGILTAYFLNPLVGKLGKLKLSRSLSAALITASFFTAAIFFVAATSPVIAEQVSNLILVLPEYKKEFETQYLPDIKKYISKISPDKGNAIKVAAGNFSGNFTDWTGNLISTILQSSFAFLNILSLLLITPVVVFYLLRDWEALLSEFDKLLPRKHYKAIKAQLHIVDLTISGFVRGQTNVCLIMAAYYAIILSVMGLNFGLIIGMLTGLLLFIPFVGFIACFATAIAVAFFQFGFDGNFIFVLATYIVGMAIEGSIITPRLVGDKVGLHPIWLIFGMLAGGAVFGFVGILIAVPVTAVIGVLVRFAIENYLQSSIYRE